MGLFDRKAKPNPNCLNCGIGLKLHCSNKACLWGICTNCGWTWNAMVPGQGYPPAGNRKEPNLGIPDGLEPT